MEADNRVVKAAAVHLAVNDLGFSGPNSTTYTVTLAEMAEAVEQGIRKGMEWSLEDSYPNTEPLEGKVLIQLQDPTMPDAVFVAREELFISSVFARDTLRLSAANINVPDRQIVLLMDFFSIRADEQLLHSLVQEAFPGVKVKFQITIT